MIFYTIGDWGELNDNLLKVSDSMDQMSYIKKPDFILSLGDNFYPNGVKDINDDKWLSYYNNVFVGKNLYCPWYSILGNHDYMGNPHAQIDYYLSKKDNRWTMPKRYYSINYKFNDKNLHIIALDTVELALMTSLSLIGENSLTKYNINRESKIKQLEWLEYQLKNSNADWLIVIGHYNLYSAGYHSSNKELISILKPLFIKYNVDLYICGHCHNLEHLYDSGINYIISGAGSKTGYVHKIYQTRFAFADIGYTIHEIIDNIMTISFINDKSNIIYKIDISQKRNL